MCWSGDGTPPSDAWLPEAVSDDVDGVIQFSEGHTSSLVAATLRDQAPAPVTDVAGGYQALAAWRHPAHGIPDDRYYRVRMRPNGFGVLVATCLRAGPG
jgi:hypothetical protein